MAFLNNGKYSSLNDKNKTPQASSSLVDILLHRAQNQPARKAYIFLENGETESGSLTYGELDKQARAIASNLQFLQGERALLLYPSGLEFISAFFGCMYAGVVAVPVYPPRRNQKLSRLLSIVNDAQAKIALTTTSVLTNIERRRAQEPELLSQLKWVATDAIEANSQEFVPKSVTPESLAFLQYTSGSTGTPKGVMVTHGNIIHNQQLIHQALGHSEKTMYVGWLPLFHDMGLITSVIQPMYVGFRCILMPPAAFMMKPIRWLKAISKYRATTSGGPNFAYDLCVRRVQQEQLVNLDLSSWDLAFNGAEPLRAETLEQFSEKFASYGFNYSAFYPCYGMAETTLFVTGGDKNQKPVIQGVKAVELEQNSVVEIQIPLKESRVFVGCGRPYMDTTVTIVNPESSTRCEKGQVGEIWLSGGSIASGYWNRPEATQETFRAYLKDTGRAPFLRTGDLGYFSNGELFVTGRIKDMIIIRGSNHYPQDIELTVEKSHPSLRENCSAAFSVEMEGEERLVVACEVERTYLRKLNTDEVVREIQIAVSTEHELEVYGVVLLKTGSIPKTSSGKIQRRACKLAFLENILNVVGQWHKTIENNPKIICSNSQLNSQDYSSKKYSKTVAEIEAWLVGKIAELLKLAPEKIDLKQPLAVYGLNSVKAVNIAAELEEWLGISVAPTIVYDYPSIRALADYLGYTTSLLKSTAFVSKSQTVTEAVAIIGQGCRFPKANNTQAFWSLLRSGDDAITKVPVSRWQSGNSWGGFLEQVDQFEPQFFNISPREAINIDPQQRLLLEVSWEALENAGLAADQLVGNRGGVFIGISSGDYAKLSGNLANTEMYYGTGNALSIAANRLSYFLDWHGPSWAVDTACSSSLVAIHQACQSLRQSECNLALAGGVNLMLSPQLTLTFSEAQMMAADGRCKTFDAGADGYVRSEGCGIVVLKRLKDALADGDNIQAIIRGSAVNQDGLTNGLTAPNGNSQQEVVRLALANAQVKPNQISYVETHGTGTSLGDPIEVNSLKAVLMEGRVSNQPCWIGSVKTNIGHLEAAAGIAGLIKLVLSLERGEIPPHLHLKQLNSYIELENTPIEICTQLQQWSSVEQPRLAGVSAFGFGGTNAHVILEEAPKKVKSQKSKINSEDNPFRPLHLLALSAKTERALEDLVGNYKNHLESHRSLAITDVCFTANTGRSHFNHRLAIVTSDKQELVDKLAKISAKEKTNGVFFGKPSNRKSPKIAFLFTGQGSQYVNMGRQLYETQSVFRRTLDRCEQILQAYLEKSLLDVLYPEDSQELNSYVIDQTAYSQPALFAIEYALFQLWQSWGIKPDVVMGHSVGEYVAATIAGVFSLEDGLKMVAHRGRLMQDLPSGGDMVAVMASEEKVNQLIAPYSEKIALAAINGPQSVVISGEVEAIRTLLNSLESQGIKTKQLQVSHAFHSLLMEPMLEDFQAVTNQIDYNQPRIPLISNVTGSRADDSITTASYWVNHVRKPVKFAQSMVTLHQEGYEVFLEIGPKTILLGMGRQCLPEGVGVWLPSLRSGQDDWQPLLHSLSELYIQGVKVDWLWFDRDYSRNKVVLPTYPWQRQRYWIATDNNLKHKKQLLSNHEDLHPLLGQRLHLAGLEQQIRFECQINASQPIYLKHHCVSSKPVLPATAYLEMALAAGSTLFNSDNLILEDIIFQQALILSEEIKTIQIILILQETQTYSFQIFSRDMDFTKSKSRWTLHVQGKLLAGNIDAERETTDLKTIKDEYHQQILVQDFYQEYRDRGIDYGSSFQAVQQLWHSEGKVLGQIQLPETLVSEVTKYQLHPVILDASFQLLAATLGETYNQKTYIPVAIKRLKVYCRPNTCLWSRVQMDANRADNFHTLASEVYLVSDDGKLIATVEELKVKRVTAQAIVGGKQESIQDWLYKVEWRTKMHFDKQLTANYLPTPSEIKLKLRPQIHDLIVQPDLELYQNVLTQLETLSIGYVLKAFGELGWEFQEGEFFSTDFISQKLGVVQQHNRLLGRVLEMLSEVGILNPVNDEWEVTQVPNIPNPKQLFNSLVTQHTIAIAELTLLQRCASQLASVLRGESDPVQLVFPEGDLTTATQLYQESPGAKVMNILVQQAVLSALEQFPKFRGVRVLEIGAGTGGTTAHILPQLNPDQTEYIFTDISSLFTTKAQERFRDYSFVRYQTLDIEQDLSTQGFESNQYDLIVAANVLHATQDLRHTLQQVQQLLAPQGMLVLLETTTRQRWLDLTFGLLEGWWRFTDVDLRPSYPLLSVKGWQQLLQKSGFQQAISLPDIQETNGVLSEQAVILAQAEDTPLSNTFTEPRGWLILADQQGIAQHLAAQLQSKGNVCALVKPGKEFQQISQHKFTINPNNPPEFEQLLLTLKGQLPSLNSVVQCWSIDKKDTQIKRCEDLQNAQQRVCGTTLSLVQALVKVLGSQPPRLWLITQGAQPVPDSNPVVSGIAQSSLWGMGKVIALEHPELKCMRVDLDPNALIENQVQALWEEICSQSVEDQVAIREESRYIARLVRHQQPQEYKNKKRLQMPQSESFRLNIYSRGSLDNLILEPTTRRSPGVREVEIRVMATGLNFRDVLNALGLYPGIPPLGAECAGTIVTIGEGVQGFEIGDCVIALASESFSQYVTVNAAMVVSKPEKLSFCEAATIPVNFLTAYYALHYIAQIKRGDRVLIHAAAGGTGMAAVQIAQQAGAEVFATASPPKWGALRSMGVQHIMNSRNLYFASEVMKITKGQGVDIVLNSLTSGEFITKSLSVVSSQGRFVEIAKRDVWESNQVANTRPDISYRVVDMALISKQQPDLIQLILQELIQQFSESRLKLPPLKQFLIQEVVSAFRYMQQAKHIGKIVVTQSLGGVKLTSEKALSFNKDGTYLITGGLGGLGLLVAHWMVGRGARHLALLGRSEAKDSVQTQLKELEQAGAKVVVYRTDVSEIESVTEVLSEIEQSLPPLRGIIHSVGVLDDGILQQQTWEKFARVMASKMQGAWNLHNLTLHKPLDFFVLFSSAASLFGSPGQANHSAANAFLDAFAYYRQSRGLPGLSINWGAVAQTGAAAKRQADEQANKKGMGAISPQQVSEALELLLSNPSGSVGAVPIRWPEFIKQWPASPFFADFIETSKSITLGQSLVKAKHCPLLRGLKVSSLREREQLLINYFKSEVAQVLGMTTSQIDVQQPLNTMGIDSLMSVELRNRVQSELAVDVPLVKFMDVINIVDLVTEVNGRLTQIDRNQGVEQENNQQILLTGMKDSKWIEVEL